MVGVQIYVRHRRLNMIQRSDRVKADRRGDTTQRGRMRKIINSTYISLDGVVERPHEWPSTGARGSRGDEIQAELLFDCDALLMGRRTYEGFAPVWPTRSDPYSDHINSMPKYVVSSTLTDPQWSNTSVISGDPVAEIRRLKAARGKSIVQYGFGRLSFAMLEHGLLDELRLWVHPLFVGSAEAGELLYRRSAGALFDLVDTTTLENGVVILSYARR
jgi:dihydrofolate reductase